tara:strand:- start:28 stop:219 length:192 start_codon:yes stop_codon:yes gene_type:complete
MAMAPKKTMVAKTTPKPTVKPKAPVGPAAVAVLKKQVSKAGVKQSEVKQKQAIDKKYPGLYKK